MTLKKQSNCHRIAIFVTSSTIGLVMIVMIKRIATCRVPVVGLLTIFGARYTVITDDAAKPELA